MNFFLFLRVLKRNHYWRDIAVKSNRMPRYRYRLLPLGHRSGPLCVCTSTYIIYTLILCASCISIFLFYHDDMGYVGMDGIS